MRFQDELSDPNLAGTPYSAVPIPGAKRFGIAIRVQCSVAENNGFSGLSAVLAKALGQDSPGKTGPLLAAELGALGGFGITDDGEAITVWGVCSHDFADIQETVHVVLSDLAIKPRIDDAIVQKARWMAMQQKASDAAARAELLYRALRATTNGSGLADFLNLTIDRRIDTARVMAHHAKWFHPTRAVITVMGGFNPRDVREVVRQTLSLVGWDERGPAPKSPSVARSRGLPSGTQRVSAGPGPLRLLIATDVHPVTSGLATLGADTLALHYLTSGRTAPLYKLRVPAGEVYDIRGDVVFTAPGYVPCIEIVTSATAGDITGKVSALLTETAAQAGALRTTDITRIRASYRRVLDERVNRMPAALLDATRRQHIGFAGWDRDVERTINGISKEMLVEAITRLQKARLTTFTTGAGAGIG